jgi:hypothetical protein
MAGRADDLGEGEDLLGAGGAAHIQDAALCRVHELPVAQQVLGHLASHAVVTLGQPTVPPHWDHAGMVLVQLVCACATAR